MYRRNMDSQLRSLQRKDFNGQAIEDVARYLRAKAQAGELTSEQLYLAACLRYPPAVLLFPDGICGMGDGDYPTLDSGGMVIRCAGARLLAEDIYEVIKHLPLPQIFKIYQVIFDTLLENNSPPINTEARNLIRDAGLDLEKYGYFPSKSSYLVEDNNERCDDCGQVTDQAELDVRAGVVTVLCEECSPQVIFNARIGLIEDYIERFWGPDAISNINAMPNDAYKLHIAILYKTLQVLRHYVDISADPNNVSLGFVLYAACVVNPQAIDTHQIAIAILNS